MATKKKKAVKKKKPVEKKNKKTKKKSSKKSFTPQNSDNPTRMITPIFRTAFVHVFKASAMNKDDAEKFSIQMLLPKDSTDMDHFHAAIEAATEEKFGSKVPKKFNLPIRDGDTDESYEDYEESHAGMYVISARATFKPGLVDKDLEDIIDPAEFYSGCWARASITAYGYEVKGNKGVAFALNNLQKLKDDDSFTGGKSASSEFGDAEDVEVDDDDDDSSEFTVDDIEVGQTVTVETDDDEFEGEVEKVTKKAIVVDGDKIKKDDIESVELLGSDDDDDDDDDDDEDDDDDDWDDDDE